MLVGVIWSTLIDANVQIEHTRVLDLGIEELLNERDVWNHTHTVER